MQATGRSTRSRSRASPDAVRPDAGRPRPGRREREWLEYAALLHDIGVHISYERHHRHSYYLIKNGDLRGFEPDEIEVIALVARYHRQATPKKAHEGCEGRAAGAARPSSGWRRWCGWPKGSIAATRRRSATSTCTTAARTTRRSCGDERSDAELELWAAQPARGPVRRRFGKPAFDSK